MERSTTFLTFLKNPKLAELKDTVDKACKMANARAWTYLVSPPKNLKGVIDKKEGTIEHFGGQGQLSGWPGPKESTVGIAWYTKAGSKTVLVFSRRYFHRINVFGNALIFREMTPEQIVKRYRQQDTS